MLSVNLVLDFQKEVIGRISAPDWGWEEACEMGLAARNMRDLSNWVIGTVACGIEKKWGEDMIGEFAKVLGFNKKTLEQYRWVVKSFGVDYQPTEGYPWSYYRLAAGTKDPKATINTIIDQDYSYLDAEKFVKGLPTIKGCPHDYEMVAFKRCQLCRKLELAQKTEF
jgi:hypothetical protein